MYEVRTARGWKNLQNLLDTYEEKGFDPIFVTQNNSTVYTGIFREREKYYSAFDPENLQAMIDAKLAEEEVSDTGNEPIPVELEEVVGADTDSVEP